MSAAPGGMNPNSSDSEEGEESEEFESDQGNESEWVPAARPRGRDPARQRDASTQLVWTQY